MPPAFIYFDLGNVLLTFSNERAHRQLADLVVAEALAVVELLAGKHECDGLQWRFEAGEVSDDEFFNACCDHFQATPDRAAFELAFSDMFSPISDTFDLVARLHAGGHRLGILSNTNVMHWRFLTDGRFPELHDFFEQQVTSFDARSMKPDQRIYDLAIERAGCAPGELLFVDDKPENVTGAIAAGIDAVQYTNHQQLCTDLAERAILAN